MITGAFFKWPDKTTGVRCGEGVQVGDTVHVRLDNGQVAQVVVTCIPRVEKGVAYCGLNEDRVHQVGRKNCAACRVPLNSAGNCPRCGL